ncbi:hypothetical protein FOCC_FOCC012386 [Frankliniella occidentalis]|nr:hypothetical protein FOCC_FOCC012386 [Frankliniella occidentalis]
MSDSDRSRLDNKMAAMGNQVGLLARISDEFASKLTVTLKTMKDHDAQIKKLTELALVRFDRMSTDATLSSALRNTHAAIASIREEVLAFVGAWEVAAMDGGLSSSFIEPHRLLDILLALTEELKPLGLQLPIPPSLANIHVFYGVIIVQPLLRNDRLTLFLHVPLVQADRNWRRVTQAMGAKDATIEEFVCMDDDVPICEELTDEEFLNKLPDEEDVDPNDDETIAEDGVEQEVITQAVGLEALSVVRKFMTQLPGVDPEVFAMVGSPLWRPILELAFPEIHILTLE